MFLVFAQQEQEIHNTYNTMQQHDDASAFSPESIASFGSLCMLGGLEDNRFPGESSP
jgi:hypothetical protein